MSIYERKIRKKKGNKYFIGIWNNLRTLTRKYLKVTAILNRSRCSIRYWSMRKRRKKSKRRKRSGIEVETEIRLEMIIIGSSMIVIK